MRNSFFALSCFTTLLALSSGEAAVFQNLNFENANTNTITDLGFGAHYGPIADLMPGWTLLRGSNTVTQVGFNNVPPGAGFATIFSPAFVGHAPVIGQYSFAMFPLYDVRSHIILIPFTLSQSGDLPAEVKQIRFLSHGGPVELDVNDSPISLTYTPVPVQPGWNGAIPVYEAEGDISPYAGLTVELKFTTLLTPDYLGATGLDEITFSSVPEPGPVTLLAAGLAALALFRITPGSRRRRSALL